MNQRTSRRRLRAISLALATIAVLAAGVLPACVPGLCCPLSDAPTVHSQMPCCDGSASIASRDLDPARPATFAGYSFTPRTWTPAVLVQRTGVLDLSLARVQAGDAIGQSPHHEPSPPLFLLNAQFLI